MACIHFGLLQIAQFAHAEPDFAFYLFSAAFSSVSCSPHKD